MTSASIVRGARGGGITLVGQACKLLLQVGSVVVLSRLLTPTDFGLVAMVTAFVAFGELLRDFGTAIVGLQRQDLRQQQASNLFWLSVLLGLFASLLLAASTPLLVAFYDEPRLASIVPALALGILLNALSSQLQVQLARAMRYAKLVLADLLSQTLGLVVAIGTAILGAGYWALVAQVLAIAVCGLALRWFFSGWMPSRPRRDSANGMMIRDSAAFGAAQFLTYLSQNADTMAIGARWDAASLGGYTRAFQLLTAPLNSLMGPLTQVVVPTVNDARRAGASVDAVLLRVQFALGLGVVWIYAMSAAVADWLVPLALGPNWDETVSLFRILAIGGAVWVFSRVSYWRFVVDNQGRQLLLYNIVTKVIATGLIVVGALVSVEATAWAVSAGLLISWPINLAWLARSSGQRSSLFLLNGMRLLLAGGIAYGVAWSVKAALDDLGPAIAVTTALIAGAVSYLALVAASAQGRTYLMGTLSTLRKVLRRAGGA